MFLDPIFLVIQVLNALQLASLLFLLSVGLSVVYGLMNFINLAHGTLYMLGAFIGLTIVRESESFWVALLLAPVAIGFLGALLHILLLRRMQAASAACNIGPAAKTATSWPLRTCRALSPLPTTLDSQALPLGQRIATGPSSISRACSNITGSS